MQRNIVPRGDDGLIDIEEARRGIASRVHPNAKSAAAAPLAFPVGRTEIAVPRPAPAAAPEIDDESAVTSYHVAKTLRETAEAQIAQLKLAEMRGDLVRRSLFVAAQEKKANIVREAILQLPAQMAPVVAAEADVARCQDVLMDACLGILARIST